MKYIKELNIDFNNWDEASDNSNEFKGHMDFYNFLTKNNALDNYLKYFHDIKSIKWRKNFMILKYYKINNFDDLNEFFNKVNPLSYFDYAFLWNNWYKLEYWDNLHFKWVKIINYDK